jgi:hypothetical protein
MKGLPARELRDTVYIQLLHGVWLSEEVHIEYCHEYYTNEYRYLEADSPHPPDSMGSRYPCCLAREYVNDDFMKELSETFYSNYSKARFLVLHDNHIDWLITYGPLSPFTAQGYVRSPLHFIRHMKIHLSIDRGFLRRDGLVSDNTI